MTIRVFVSGQSNALGRATGGPDWSVVSSAVRVWNNVNPLGANGTAFVSAATAKAGGTFENTNRNNFGVWFCDRLSRHASDGVDMTIVARGNSAIALWDPAEVSFPMLQECIDVWAATAQPPADVFLWHQGEANVTVPTHEGYRDEFLAIVSNLKSGGVLDDDTIIVVCGLVEENDNRIDFNNGALKALPAENRRITYASSTSLGTYDGTHFDGDALYWLGADRAFSAYLSASESPIYALVNEGGTPGEAGSGENKVLDVIGALRSGYKLRGPPRLITYSQTYELDSDVSALLVEVLGGGGGGNGAASSSGYARAAGGGAAGSYGSKFIESPEASYAVVVGAGGAGGMHSDSFGGEGGETSFGIALSAPGGQGGWNGSTSVQDVFIRNGGATGGPGSGGDINLAGAEGGKGMKLTPSVRVGGDGADSKYGSGGRGFASGSTGNSTNGAAGDGYGSGGAGGISSTTVDAVGGDGAPGLVVVHEFVR